jgi:putative ABC transport system permease protein
MWRNYWITAFRNLKRQKAHAIINIAGLAVGMACCILILLWVQDELSYDKYHKNVDGIYRIALTEHRDTGDSMAPHAFSPVAPLLKNEYPGITDFVRFGREYRALVSHGNNSFVEERFFYADSTVFRIFDFVPVKGDASSALVEPFSVMLTETTAEKYFGDENPIGKTLHINAEQDYVVTGVLKNTPRNSHIQFDFLASFSSLYAEDEKLMREYWAYRCYTYLLIPNPNNATQLNKAFPDFIFRHKGERWASYIEFHLQPLKSIHLHSNLNYELESNGDIRYVYTFSLVAFLVLAIACINFINLSTARSTIRAREVGLRKVLGAYRSHLTRQFFCEASLFALVAIPFAILCVELALPAFNQVSSKNLTIHYTGNGTILLSIIGIISFVGLVSGSYPAFLLSSFQPAEVLKSKHKPGASRSAFRKCLVIIQFSVSIILIIGTLVVQHQIDFIKNERLGFHKQNRLVLRVDDPEMKKSYPSFKNELLKHTNILAVTASNGVPSRNPGISIFRQAENQSDQNIIMRSLLVDYDFTTTMGIEMMAGRNFSHQMATDASEAFIINETAAEMFGWSSPVGKEVIDLDSGQGRVIGMVKDFHFRSKHQEIEPLVIKILPDRKYISYITIHINTSHARSVLSFIESHWQSFSPNRPFDHFFLDESFDKLYRSEERLGTLFRGFTLLTIFIACLGLFGLASFTAERRTKEVGIRKVVGASVANIVLLLSREFLKWVLLANLIAWPLAYLILNEWLKNFSYQVDIRIWTFILSTALALAVALITVSYQSIKAALANPVESLKYE